MKQRGKLDLISIAFSQHLTSCPQLRLGVFSEKFYKFT